MTNNYKTNSNPSRDDETAGEQHKAPFALPADHGGSAELLTLRQAAALCGVSERHLWGCAKAGISPPPLRIGKGVVRYSKGAYLDWIAAGCKPVKEGGHE